VIGTDGRLKRTVIWQCLPGATPRVDEQGNIYLAEIVKPAGRSYPAFFDGKLKPPGKIAKGASGDRFWTSYVSGSIIKFPPGGGVIGRRVDGRDANYAFGIPTKVKGALWIHSGASNVPSWRTKGTPDICLCVPMRFDVDEFGRVFYPDAARFRAGVLDGNGNVITHFGSYGNQDSAGPGSAVAQPEIAFAWPQVVAADSRAVYVADQLNRRIVRVKLAYAAEAVCPVSK